MAKKLFSILSMCKIFRHRKEGGYPLSHGATDLLCISSSCLKYNSLQPPALLPPTDAQSKETGTRHPDAAKDLKNHLPFQRDGVNRPAFL